MKPDSPMALSDLLRPRRALQNLLVQSVGASGAIQACLFVSGVIVARSLGPASRGNLALVLILPPVCVQVVALGIPSALTVFIARQELSWRDVRLRLIPVGVIQLILASALLLALGSQILVPHGSVAVRAGVVAALSVPFQLIGLYVSGILQGLHRIKAFNLMRILPVSLFALSLVGLAMSRIDLWRATLAWLASHVVTVIVGCELLRRDPPRAEIRSRATSIPTIIRFGISGFFAQVSPLETFKVDQLLVGAWFSSVVVGYYAVAASLSNVSRFIADAVATVAYPTVAALPPGPARTRMIRQYVLVASGLCVAAAAPLIVGVRWIVPALFGVSFRPATPIAVLLIVGSVIISVRRVGLDCLRAIGKPGYSTLLEVGFWIPLGIGFATVGRAGRAIGIAESLLIAAVVGVISTAIVLFQASSTDEPRTPIAIRVAEPIS